MYVLKSFKKMTDNLLNDLQSKFSQEGGCVFQEKLDHVHFLALSVNEDCKAMTFSRNTNIEQCSADSDFVIVTMMEEIAMVVVKKVCVSRGFMFHTNMHLLTNSTFWISNLRNLTQNWTIEYLFASRKMSTETLIQKT